MQGNSTGFCWASRNPNPKQNIMQLHHRRSLIWILDWLFNETKMMLSIRHKNSRIILWLSWASIFPPTKGSHAGTPLMHDTTTDRADGSALRWRLTCRYHLGRWKFTKCAKSSMTYQRACLNFHNKSSSKLISFPRQLYGWLPVVKKAILTPSEYMPATPVLAMKIVECWIQESRLKFWRCLGAIIGWVEDHHARCW